MSRIMKHGTAVLLMGLFILSGCSDKLPEELMAPIPDVPVPTNLTALLGENEVTLAWSSDAGFNYSGFSIYRNEVGGAPSQIATATVSPWVDNGVRSGATYEYRVAGLTPDGIEGKMSVALVVRATTFSMAINTGAAYTNSRNVVVNLGAPAATQLVRASEDPAFAGAQWLTFFTPVPFQLSQGDGLKTIYVQFTDELGHPTTTISDDITLDTETSIQSATFTPSGPASPGTQLHFTVTPAGTELNGIADILLQGFATTLVAYDDGTGGDPNPNDGIYETDFVVPQALRGIDLTVTTFFTDAAANRSDQFEMAARLSITDPPQQAVTLLPAQNVTVSSVSLRWNQTTGANFNRYEAYRSTSGGVTTDDLRIASITDLATTVFVDNSLDEGTTYYYRVFVANDLNEVIGSNEITAQTLDDPPTAVVLSPVSSVTQTSLTLTWTQNTNTDFKAYRVYRATTPGVTDLTGMQIGADIIDRFTTFYDDSGINTTLNTYYYRVYVIDQANNKTRSNEVSVVDAQTAIQSAIFTPSTPAVPGASLLFTVTPVGNELGGSARITIATFATPITALDTGTGGDDVAGDGVYKASFTVPPSLRGTGLAVSAVFTDGAGNQSSAFEFANLFGVTDPPQAVTMLSPLSVTTSSIQLLWQQSTNAHFVRYEVYRATSPGITGTSSPRIASMADAGTVQFNDAGLDEGATYYYKVYVVNDLNEKTGSNEIAASTDDQPPTAVVLDPVSSVTQTSLTLTWSQNGNTDFKAYRVYRSTTAGVTDVTGTQVGGDITNRTTTFLDDSGLNTGINTYYYRVYVVDQANNKTRSNEVVAQDTQANIQSASFTPTTPRQPGQVVHFIVTPVGTELGGSAQITIAGHGGTITARDNGTGGDQSANNGVYETDFTIPASLRGVGLAVTAVFTDAAANQSAPFQFPNLLSITDPPAAVTLFSVQDSTTTTISLLWSQSADPDFQRYELYRSTTPSVSKSTSFRVTTIVDVSANSFTDTNLEEGMTYYYRVYVGNDLDEFTGSNVRQAHTADVPPTAVVLNDPSSVTQSSLTLSWSQNANTDFDAYIIRRSTSPGVTMSSQQVAIISNRFQTFFDESGLDTVANVYYYRVYVRDKAQNQTRSNEVDTVPGP